MSDANTTGSQERVLSLVWSLGLPDRKETPCPARSQRVLFIGVVTGVTGDP